MYTVQKIEKKIFQKQLFQMPSQRSIKFISVSKPTLKYEMWNDQYVYCTFLKAWFPILQIYTYWGIHIVIDRL